jgi:hypothetical protein
LYIFTCGFATRAEISCAELAAGSATTQVDGLRDMNLIEHALS